LGHFSNERVRGVLGADLHDVHWNPALHHHCDGRLELLFDPACAQGAANLKNALT
jgi:hypothetical protein